MEELTAEQAVQALAAAWNEDEGSQAPEATPAAEEAPSEGTQQTESNQEASEEKPSGLFYDVDPESLTPEMRQMFDGMQKAFTEKNQALATERKQLESFGTAEQIQSAVEFVQSLQDPQNLVQLHSDLSEYLQQAGYTKADADAAAASAVTEAAQEQETDFGFEDPQVAQLKAQLDALNEWKSGFEQQQEQAAIEAQIERTELQLRQDREYSDDDVSRVYQLAWAHGGDLVAAADAYDAWRNEILAGYVTKKAEAPQVIPPTATGHGQPIPSFGSDFEAAHKHAKALAIAAQNAGQLDD